MTYIKPLLHDCIHIFSYTFFWRREDDQPESECGSVVLNPGSGERVAQPVFLILKQLLPTYLNVANTYSQDMEIQEVVCSNLKQAVSTIQDDIRPLTPQVSCLLPNFFSCFHRCWTFPCVATAAYHNLQPWTSSNSSLSCRLNILSCVF